mgnify:CR=1 FL=1
MTKYYSDKFYEYFNQTTHRGKLKNISISASAMNPICGDKIELFLEIDELDTIKNVSYLSNGCAATLAIASLASEKISDQTIKNALLISKDDLIKDIGGLPENKFHASTLMIQVIHQAIDKWSSS